MSTLRLTTISNQTGSASVPSDTVINGSAKAWVNFDGTGTVAIRASFNVSSITDNGTGNYTVNFTTAFADANYAACGTANGSGNYGDRQLSATPTSGSACRLYSGVTAAVTLYDANYMMASFFR
jgi:hypothetical protein